ncbi:MAG: ABC transporter ATP-binding protein [Bryobacteraceae bacterium]
MTAIECSGISKLYRIYHSPSKLLLELLTFRRRTYHQDFHALRDVSFEIHQGESVALLGQNGSGKSTLLQIVAGILTPTAGDLRVDGRVAALLELGSGFNPDFTGRDNALLGISLLGIVGSEASTVYRQVIEFADIGEFVDQPVRIYSSGMAVRLAFAVAIHCKPEILLVDEALSVGDLAFRTRCFQKVAELRGRGVTLVLVSHSAAEAKQFCDRAIWLDQGALKQVGPAERVVDEYLAAMTERDARYAVRHHEVSDPVLACEVEESAGRFFSLPERAGASCAKGAITGLALLSDRGYPVSHMEALQPIHLKIRIQAKQDLKQPTVGFVIRNHMGMIFSGSDTDLELCTLPSLAGGECLMVSFRITPPELYRASLAISVFLSDGGNEMCDVVDNAFVVQMLSTGKVVYGQLHVPSEVKVHTHRHAVISRDETNAVDVV